MIQFEEVILEESRNICEQLNSYSTKEGRHTSLGMSPAKDSIDFGTIKPLKRATVAIRVILLIITALTIYLFFTISFVDFQTIFRNE